MKKLKLLEKPFNIRVINTENLIEAKGQLVIIKYKQIMNHSTLVNSVLKLKNTPRDHSIEIALHMKG